MNVVFHKQPFETRQVVIQNQVQTEDCDCKNKETVTDSIANITTQKDIFQIYPNPTYGVVNIQTNQDKDYIVDVCDQQGTILLTSHENQIDLSKFPSGFYFIKVRSNTFVQIKPIIKVN
jgi:hypothetical protein